jgi:hypothetical protein
MPPWVSTSNKTWHSDRREYRESGDSFEVEHLQATSESRHESNEEYEFKMTSASLRFNPLRILNASAFVIAFSLLTAVLVTVLAYEAGTRSGRYTPVPLTPVPEGMLHKTW